jgi:hypothetical protein
MTFVNPKLVELNELFVGRKVVAVESLDEYSDAFVFRLDDGTAVQLDSCSCCDGLGIEDNPS